MADLKAFAPSLPISIEARATSTNGLLEFSFHVQGDTASILFSRAPKVGRRDELWKHTCFEAFLQPAGTEAYFEFNFSPSGDWNVYAFDGYRAGMRAEARVATVQRFSFRSKGQDAWFDCAVDVSALGLSSSGFRLGLSAVIETTRGEKSYWALQHPGDQPDFHDTKGFQLEFAPSSIRN